MTVGVQLAAKLGRQKPLPTFRFLAEYKIKTVREEKHKRNRA